MDEKAIEEEVLRILEDKELADTDRIKALHALGFNRKQLIEDFHFSRSLVYQILPVKQETQGEHNDRNLPVTIKSTEVITPESIMQRLSDGSDAWQLRLEGMMLLRAAQKMVRDDVAIYDSLVAAQAKAIEGQLKILREAKSESEEVALKAATAVGEQVIEFMGQHMKQKADIATVPQPFEGLMAKMMETAMTNLMGAFFPQGATPAGFTVRKVKEE